MTAPKNEIVQTMYQNPHATKGLMLSMLIVSNTSDEDLERNIRANSSKYDNWMQLQDAHDGVAVMLGGGASINDNIEDIRELQKNGATIFAMNAASQWARGHGIEVDYQVIVDAKEETASLVDSGANAHLFASQCNEKTLEKSKNLTLWHLELGNIESFFPQERVKKGGYVLVGGGASVGNSALCVAYTQGFRDLHVFGYDSSHKDGQSHAYSQPMNEFMPTTEVKWAGRTFTVSVAMKAQAEKFQITSQALKQAGCTFHIYGDGLLQTMYNSKPTDLSEKDKYQLMWQFDDYRQCSPGENIADFFISMVKPEGLIIDFGCGTGRAGIKFAQHGLETLLIDFTDNSRDEEAQSLPFLQWDLTQPCPAMSEYGFCTDVMEHIPTKDVETVIDNIMAASKNVFFQISTVEDHFGAAIDHPLHLTVKPHEWWKGLLSKYRIEWDQDQGNASLFYVKQQEHSHE